MLQHVRYNKSIDDNNKSVANWTELFLQIAFINLWKLLKVLLPFSSFHSGIEYVKFQQTFVNITRIAKA